jgi:hypothetical protein
LEMEKGAQGFRVLLDVCWGGGRAILGFEVVV